MTNTSWEKVSGWYTKTVGEKGHYYHREVILPNLLRLINKENPKSVADLGCGQGILGRNLSSINNYVGFDLSETLIREAREMDTSVGHKYVVADISKEIENETSFDIATIVLALQNVKKPFKVLQNISRMLRMNGKVYIVLNHPMFRIPKHSDWKMSQDRKIQYRCVDSYMSPLEIPIDSSPFDKKDNHLSWSYHYPLSAYSEMLQSNGLLIEKIEEWVSNKKSTGSMAKIENKAREEFPLFMLLVAKKLG